MSIYWVTHPNIDVSATVYAPSTEKARTVFLDYLERSSQISRPQRGPLRVDMVAEKIRDPYAITSDVELHYGEPSREGEEPTVALGETSFEEDAEMFPEERASIGRGQPSGRELEVFTQQAYEETGIDLRPKTREMPIKEIQKTPTRIPIQEKALGRLG